MNAEELNKIILSMQNAIQITGIDQVSDDILFSKAVDFYMFKESQKRIIQSQPITSDPDKATPKQLAMLERMGFQGNFNEISKKEASKVIDEFIKKKNQENQNEN
jgi:hypothetical protein